MLVRVQYKNEKYDMVRDFMLDQLIGAGKVWRFLRSSGWAVIGRDPVRNRPNSYYLGPERRKN